MSVTMIAWLAVFATGAALAVQWVVLRARYLEAIAQQRARHQQHQQATQAQLDVAKQQIGRLQLDTSTLRLQLKRYLAREPVKATPAPARARADAAPAHPALPVDGFADTLPTPQYPHDISLLKH